MLYRYSTVIGALVAAALAVTAVLAELGSVLLELILDGFLLGVARLL